MYPVAITAAKLEALRMLADWQLTALGFDPASVTAAAAALDDDLAAMAEQEIEDLADRDEYAHEGAGR